jgi:hypothetical protein
METQTLKPGKCSLTLDASRIIWETQQTSHQMLLQPSPAYQQLPLSANKAWEKLSTSTSGNLTNFQILAGHPLLLFYDAFTQREAHRSNGAHVINKGLEC